MLDQLMGPERNVALDKRTNRKRHHTDPDQCKFHLAGLSPADAFKNTKSETRTESSTDNPDNAVSNNAECAAGAELCPTVSGEEDLIDWILDRRAINTVLNLDHLPPRALKGVKTK